MQSLLLLSLFSVFCPCFLQESEPNQHEGDVLEEVWGLLPTEIKEFLSEISETDTTVVNEWVANLIQERLPEPEAFELLKNQSQELGERFFKMRGAIAEKYSALSASGQKFIRKIGEELISIRNGSYGDIEASLNRTKAFAIRQSMTIQLEIQHVFPTLTPLFKLDYPEPISNEQLQQAMFDRMMAKLRASGKRKTDRPVDLEREKAIPMDPLSVKIRNATRKLLEGTGMDLSNGFPDILDLKDRLPW